MSPFPDDPNVFDFLCHNIAGSIPSTKEREREKMDGKRERRNTHTDREALDAADVDTASRLSAAFSAPVFFSFFFSYRPRTD